MAGKGKCHTDKKDRERFLIENGFTPYRAPRGGSSHETWRNEQTGVCITVCASPANGTWDRLVKVVNAHQELYKTLTEAQLRGLKLGHNIAQQVKKAITTMIRDPGSFSAEDVLRMQGQIAADAAHKMAVEQKRLCASWRKAVRHALKMQEPPPTMSSYLSRDHGL
jgi:hypothetical protein